MKLIIGSWGYKEYKKTDWKRSTFSSENDILKYCLKILIAFSSYSLSVLTESVVLTHYCDSFAFEKNMYAIVLVRFSVSVFRIMLAFYLAHRNRKAKKIKYSYAKSWLSMVFCDGRGQIFRRQSGLDFLAENSKQKAVC